MFDKCTENDLLVLLNISDLEDFLRRLDSSTYQRRLQDLIEQHRYPSRSFISALLDKGIFAASVPIDFLWMVVSLGLLGGSSLLIPLTVFALLTTGALAWYAITVSAKAKMAAQEDLIREKVSQEIKNAILLILQQRARDKLADEFRYWEKNLQLETSTHCYRQELRNLLGQTVLLPTQSPDARFLQRPFNAESSSQEQNGTSFVIPMIACAIASTLLMTFFWGSCEIFAAMGFLTLSASLLGPVGFGVATFIALGVGIYIGYNRYCYQQHINNIKKDIRQLTHENQARLNQYIADKTLLNTLQMNRTETDPNYTQTASCFDLFSQRKSQAKTKRQEITVKTETCPTSYFSKRSC